MAAIAAAPAKEAGAEKRRMMAALLSSPTVVAALLSGVIAIVVGFVTLIHTLQAQNHEKSLEIRTELASDMGKSFTLAVAAGQRVASGLTFGPTGDRLRNAALHQAAYNSGLGQWEIDGSRIMAELSARYPGDEIVHEWALYRQAVTRFYRLSAVLPPGERQDFIRRLRWYFKWTRETSWAAHVVPDNERVNWQALERERGFQQERGVSTDLRQAQLRVPRARRRLHRGDAEAPPADLRSGRGRLERGAGRGAASRSGRAEMTEIRQEDR
jgi:hypothetical protein